MQGGTHGGPGAWSCSPGWGGSDGWGVLLLRLRRIWVASVSVCPAVTPGLCLGFLLGPGLSCWSRGLWRTLDVENVSMLSQLGLLRGFPRERGEGGVWPAWRGAQLGTGPTGSTGVPVLGTRFQVTLQE